MASVVGNSSACDEDHIKEKNKNEKKDISKEYSPNCSQNNFTNGDGCSALDQTFDQMKLNHVPSEISCNGQFTPSHTTVSQEIKSKESSHQPTNKDEPDTSDGIEYVSYESELQMPQIMKLITDDLSEPYSIYTYRYFIHNWPELCFLAMHKKECVGVIVCKLDMHKKLVKRGYIAMLAVAKSHRKRGIGSHLVVKAIKSMVADHCDEVVLETEISNKAALNLYQNLGFVRDKRLFRYYLNGVDALRLKLWLK